jgi:hypothetical protein
MDFPLPGRWQSTTLTFILDDRIKLTKEKLKGNVLK